MLRARYQSSSPGRGEIFRSPPDRPTGPSNFLYNRYRLFWWVKAAGTWCLSSIPLAAEITEHSFTATLHLGLHDKLQGELSNFTLITGCIIFYQPTNALNYTKLRG